MLKKLLVTSAIAAKTLALAAAVLLYAGSATTADTDEGDCPWMCVPPPCDPDCDGES